MFKDNTALEFFKNMSEAGDLKSKDSSGNRQLQPPRSGSGQAAWWQPAITMFLKLSVWIAGPVIIALYIGKWLDSKYDSDPWLFLVSMGIAFAVSLFGLIRGTSRELKKFEKK